MIGPFIYGAHSKISPPQLLILISVRNSRKYGYEILRDLKELFEGEWEPKTGAIYPAIKKLQENGLLVSEMVGDKEYYSLPDAGRDFLVHVLPRVGAMAAVSARFTAIVDRVREEFGLERSSALMHCCDTEERLRHLRETREHLESSLKRINEIIEKIEGGSEWEN